MKGRWAAGIEPRNFAWILKDQLAVSERPGGFAPHHRRVRRQEEILWLNAHGFTRVVSLLPSNHNLHAYDELHIPAAHYALPGHGDARPVLAELYGALWDWLHGHERVLLHQDELGEQVAGVVAGFLCWSGLLPEPPRAVSAVEQLVRRQMGHAGRAIVATAAEMPPGPGPRHRAPATAAVPEPSAPAATRPSTPAPPQPVAAATPAGSATAPQDGPSAEPAVDPPLEAAPDAAVAAAEPKVTSRRAASAKAPATKDAPAKAGNPAGGKAPATRRAAPEQAAAAEAAPAEAVAKPAPAKRPATKSAPAKPAGAKAPAKASTGAAGRSRQR